jgi:hypothetical protein
VKKSRAGRRRLLNLGSYSRHREVFEGRGEGLQLYLSTSTGDVGGVMGLVRVHITWGRVRGRKFFELTCFYKRGLILLGTYVDLGPSGSRRWSPAKYQCSR